MEILRNTCPSSKGTIELITIKSATGASATLSTFGAGIVSLCVPDASGHIDDVVLGYRNPADYIYDGPCFGKIPGRYANRIARGLFTIDGKQYHLAINNGPNALHGGVDGFQNHNWTLESIDNDSDSATVTFAYHSADGEEGYPGNLCVKASYTFGSNCELRLQLTAVTDAPTVVNLTNHTYFNLDPESAGSVLDHELRLAASSFLPSDDTLVPTGELDPVEQTPMDFLHFKPLGRDIGADFMPLKIAKGYDHCFPIEGYRAGELREVAWLRSPRSRRMLTVATTQPGIQVYTGNWLAGCPESKTGRPYADYDGVALECQHYPDSPNKPQFPSTVLRPGQIFNQTIIFKFTTY